MKKTLIIFVLFILCKNIFSQDLNSFYTEIYDHFRNKEFYDVIKKIDILLSKYPDDKGMHYNRGLAKLNLNDYVGARVDFINSKGFGVNQNDEFINYMTSKSYMVNLLTKNYLDNNVELKEENDFKKIYTLKDSLQGALRPERTCYDIYFYNLTVKILTKDINSIEGSNDIYFKTTEKTNKIQVDLSSNYNISSISWKGKELKYKRVFNAIFISFDEYLPANQNEIITINYYGIPRNAPSPPWNGGFVWKKNRNKWWIGVACEHLGASSWWPCKDHLTEKPDSMRINIQVPIGYQAISNGNLRSTHQIDNKYTNFEWFVSYPINSYCVTFYMGKFVNFSEQFTNSNGSYNIDYYVLPQHLKKAKKYYSQTKDIVKVYEKLYGEYPYKNDGMAMVESPYEGMEHQSAIAIGGDYGKTKRRNYENTAYDYLVVHETAHEWWGNTVTMGDMADAWISEAFATYSEHLFMEEKFGYNEYISASAKNMGNIYNIWPIVGNRDVNDDSFLGGDIYHKGAAMLNNLRCTINDDSLFFSLIKGFYNQYKYKIATTKDFIKFVNITTGKDYTDFLYKFLYDTDPPTLMYSYSLKNDTLAFTFRWINVGDDFTMPFSITTNDFANYRLDGTTKSQTLKLGKVSSFYLPNDKRYKKDQITKNSFTYYWTSWVQ